MLRVRKLSRIARSLVIIALLVMGPGVQAKEPDPSAFLRLKDKYDAAFAKVEERFDDRLAKLDNQYLEGLEQLKERSKKQGDLETILAADAEIKRVMLGEPLAIDPAAFQPQHFHTLQQRYQKTRFGIVTDRRKMRARMARQYAHALESMTKTLTQQGLVEDAIKARDERERVEAAYLVDVEEPIQHMKKIAKAASKVPEPIVHEKIQRDAILADKTLRLWLEFEGLKEHATSDTSTPRYNAKIHDAVRVDEGRLGAARKFNGKSSYIEIPSRGAITGRGAFSISLWFKTSANEHDQMLIQQRDRRHYNGQYMLYLGVQGRVNWWTFGENQFAFQTRAQPELNDGKWHHVVAQRDQDGTAWIYIDGQEQVKHRADPVKLIECKSYIGADMRDNSRFFEGQIDDVRIYDRALGPDEVKALYDE